MKRFFASRMLWIGGIFLLVGCAAQNPSFIQITGESVQESRESIAPEECLPEISEATVVEESWQETSEPIISEEIFQETSEFVIIEESVQESYEPPLPVHSLYYISDLSVEDVIRYFNEVCLNAEIINSGDPTKLQRWEQTIWYTCYGDYTDTDREVMQRFMDWLNDMEGFPGIYETQDATMIDLNIYFCDQEEYLERMGDNYLGTDGGVTFWYNGADQIYDAVIGYRTDIAQEVRNSVILEEIYNGLGPINDTQYRSDSIIYSGYSTPQSLTEVDELILKLLYHPEMRCGMDAAECEAVIRQIYY